MRREHRLVGEALEGVVHALGRLAGHGQKAHAGAVGRFLLAALVGKQGVLQIGLRTGNDSAADIGHVGIVRARTRRHRADAEQHRDDRGGLCIGKLLAHLRQVPADDVAGLVREHADQLIGCRRLHQRAGIDEDVARIHDEGVERLVVDDDDLNALIAQARDLEDRRYVFAQQLLDLGIANHRDAGIGAVLGAGRDGSQRDRRSRNKRYGAGSWLHRTRLARRICWIHLGQFWSLCRDPSYGRRYRSIQGRHGRRAAARSHESR